MLPFLKQRTELPTKSMKVLVANKFWYRRGGDCIYAINLEQLLRKNGIQTAVFAMSHPENIQTAYDDYFPSEISFNGAKSMLGTAARSLGLGEVRTKFSKLLDEFWPDVVHLNNIHTQLSPVLAEIAHKRGIKVVWTLHDYKLLCPRYDCLQNGLKLCEECFKCKVPVLRHKCMKDTLPASVLAYLEAVYWNRKRLERCVDTFICPSEFLRRKMLQGGFKAEKLVHLCNFIDTDKCRRDQYDDRADYCCYVGRLSHEKGVKTLIDVANELPNRTFVIIGDGPLRDRLQYVTGNNVKFVGRKEWPEIKEIVGKAKFTIIPSEWYENNPLSVIESKCLGTPVLGADIGGISELIDDTCGKTFKSGNLDDLKESIEYMFNGGFSEYNFAEKSCAEYNAKRYYIELMRIYAEKD